MQIMRYTSSMTLISGPRGPAARSGKSSAQQSFPKLPDHHIGATTLKAQLPTDAERRPGTPAAAPIFVLVLVATARQSLAVSEINHNYETIHYLMCGARPRSRFAGLLCQQAGNDDYY